MIRRVLLHISSELEDVREHDRRVTEEADKAQRDVSFVRVLFISLAISIIVCMCSNCQVKVNTILVVASVAAVQTFVLFIVFHSLEIVLV
jgi:hypothetical protein